MITVLLLLAAGPSMASETIRVAVFLNQPSLTVTGQGVFTLHSSNGQEFLRLRGPLKILPGALGMRLNRRSTDLEELLIRTDAPSLVLNGESFSGTFRIKQQGRDLLAINELDLEDYLKGVVPVEISPRWHPEALKAQAVAARTYALYKRQANQEMEYDLMATTADQVYVGQSQEHPTSNQAIAETRGLVLAYEGRLILAAYHSTSAGPTEDAEVVWGLDLPYLKGVNCPFDRYSPRYQWVREIPLDGIQEAFLQYGYPIEVISTLTPFDWTASGRVSRIRVLHSEGEIILQGEELRRILGYSELLSTQFVIEHIGPDVRFLGKGSGHGVGLCQWGAKEMAEMGYHFDRILQYFYPGVKAVSYTDLK